MASARGAPALPENLDKHPFTMNSLYIFLNVLKY